MYFLSVGEIPTDKKLPAQSGFSRQRLRGFWRIGLLPILQRIVSSLGALCGSNESCSQDEWAVKIVQIGVWDLISFTFSKNKLGLR